MQQKHQTTFKVHSCLKINEKRCVLKDFTFDMWDFLFSITENTKALRHSLICLLHVVYCCFYSYVTYISAWSHIQMQKCMLHL